MPKGWSAKFNQAIEWPGKFLSNGGHAQQDIPSQHRLLNAVGMSAGWWMMDQMRQVVFGLKMKSEGEYVEIKKEEVIAPLRFLHKAIDWDPHSETPDNQWKKLAYQLFPGAGAGLGAVAGSMYAFERNGRAQTSKTLKGLEKLGLLDADFAAQYSQSTALRALSAFFGTFSAASGLTFFYGMFLNNAFMAANGAKMYVPGALAAGNLAPHRAGEAQMATLESYLKAGKGEQWAEQFVTKVMEPMFGHKLNTPELEAQAVKTLQAKAQQYLSAYKGSKKVGAARDKEFAEKAAQDVVKALGLDAKDAKLGHANPLVYGFQNLLNSVGLGGAIASGEQPKINKEPSYGWPLAGAAAAGVGAAALLSGSSASASEHRKTANSTAIAPTAETPPTTENGTPAEPVNPLLAKHPEPDSQGKTPAEYVEAAMKLHNINNKASPPALLKWMGDAQLAVMPTNRLYCAIGLTAGLMIAGNMAKIGTGYGLDKKAVEFGKIPSYLQGMHKVVKDYNPNDMFKARNRLIYYGQWAVYSLGGLLGIKAGTEAAYSNVKIKNKDPHYLEDYLPRVSMHQGETWSWLSSFAGIFGSASGLFNLPIPGLNYAVSLASRATSMQDRNFMLGGTLGGITSGAATSSFLRLREGVNYLCHYAVNNPAETPAQIEFLAYTLLGPIFKDQLTVEHIKRFTEAVHEVRDQYWQEGGIPKAKRKEALETMREVFTGAGLEVLLIDMGLNPATISFEKLNGMTGAIGNLGVTSAIRAEQAAYHHSLEEHLKTYVEQGLLSQDRADWVRSGMEAMKRGERPYALPPETSTELQAPSTKENAQKVFADKAPRKNSIEDLIQRSEKPGDWREAAQLSKENQAPAAVGG